MFCVLAYSALQLELHYMVSSWYHVSLVPRPEEEEKGPGFIVRTCANRGGIPPLLIYFRTLVMPESIPNVTLSIDL